MYLCDTGTSEGYYDSHHINGELKLQKLGDAVVHVSPPHHGLHYTGEVIVRQDDVRGLLGHVCTCDALSQQKNVMYPYVSIRIKSSLQPQCIYQPLEVVYCRKISNQSIILFIEIHHETVVSEWCRFLPWKPCSGQYTIDMIIS